MSTLSSASYRRSEQLSTRGRVLYDSESPLGRELAWAESDNVIVFVTSTDLSLAQLAAVADTVYVER